MSIETVALLDDMPEASRQVVLDVFGPRFRLRFVRDDSAEAKHEAAVGADALLTMWGRVDAYTIRWAAGAKVIQKLGVGVDKIDVAAASAHGITVLKAAGINAGAVAELAVLLTLGVGRRLAKALDAARTGQSHKEALRAESFQLLGKTVGLLGLGNIGQAVAHRLSGFGVSIQYFDLRRAPADVEDACRATFVDLDELIRTSDVISLHLPSTPRTDHIVDAAFLKNVKPGLILVNTARGSLVDEGALLNALRDGTVLGAGLDVTDPEPPPADSPLLRHDRVLVTPHVGGAVANNFPRVVERAFRNVTAVLDGRPLPDPADAVPTPAPNVKDVLA